METVDLGKIPLRKLKMIRKFHRKHRESNLHRDGFLVANKAIKKRQDRKLPKMVKHKSNALPLEKLSKLFQLFTKK